MARPSHFNSLAFALGLPASTAVLRSTPEDFTVTEELGFTPSGDGEHLLLQVRKREADTAYVAANLARLCQVSPRNVSYAGRKDRYAVTDQWFSILSGNKPEPDWKNLPAGIEVLQCHRHRRKLKRGALKANRFRIILREVRGGREEIAERIATVMRRGVPNYFGPQRFGHEEKNLSQASALFRHELKTNNRELRGLYLSAARSFLFNEVLSKRVAENIWESGIPGDVFQLDGSRSVFPAPEITAEMIQRLADKDLHPTGPLWGKGERMVQEAARKLEDEVLNQHPLFREGLEEAGLEQERRSLRLHPADLAWCFEADTLLLEFRLPPGCFATAVIRELVTV